MRYVPFIPYIAGRLRTTFNVCTLDGELEKPLVAETSPVVSPLMMPFFGPTKLFLRYSCTREEKTWTSVLELYEPASGGDRSVIKILGVDSDKPAAPCHDYELLDGDFSFGDTSYVFAVRLLSARLEGL